MGQNKYVLEIFKRRNTNSSGNTCMKNLIIVELDNDIFKSPAAQSSNYSEKNTYELKVWNVEENKYYLWDQTNFQYNINREKSKKRKLSSSQNS